MTDAELILLSRGGDRHATETLFERYGGLVHGVASEYFMPRASAEDLVQEGMIGLCNAVERYRATAQANFRTFAALCVRRAIITAVKASTRGKHAPLNHADSFARPLGDGDGSTVEDLLGDDETPFEELTKQEDARALFAVLDSELTNLERQSIVGVALEGRSYPELANELGVGEKAIDNAMQRGRAKCQRALGAAA